MSVTDAVRAPPSRMTTRPSGRPHVRDGARRGARRLPAARGRRAELRHRLRRREGRRAARHRRRPRGRDRPRSSRPTPRTSTAAARAGLAEGAARPAAPRPASGSPRSPTAVRDVAALPDPVGEVVRGSTLPNGLRLRQVRVPMGVVGMIYEARPNVTVDAAGARLKSGNAAILRGGSAARESNDALVGGRRATRSPAPGCPPTPSRLLDAWGRDGGRRAHARPRPGRPARSPAAAPASSARSSRVDGAGHRDRRGQLPRLRRRRRRPRPGAARSSLNAKTHRVSVCNAAETLLVHADVGAGVPARGRCPRSAEPASTVHVDERARRRRRSGRRRHRARDRRGLGTEVPRLDIARAPSSTSLDAALEHIRRWSQRPHRGDRHQRPARPPTVRRRGGRGGGHGQRLDAGSPTAASSASAPRSASPPRSCTPAARWACAELTSTKWIVSRRRPRPRPYGPAADSSGADDDHGRHRGPQAHRARGPALVVPRAPRTSWRGRSAGCAPGRALDVGAAGGGNTRVLQRARLDGRRALEYGAEGARGRAERGIPWSAATRPGCRSPTASLDLVVAYDVLEHIDDDAAAAKRSSSCCGPAARSSSRCPCDTRLWSAHDEAVDHVRRYTRAELLGLLDRRRVRARRRAVVDGAAAARRRAAAPVEPRQRPRRPAARGSTPRSAPSSPPSAACRSAGCPACRCSSPPGGPESSVDRAAVRSAPSGSSAPCSAESRATKYDGRPCICV